MDYDPHYKLSEYRGFPAFREDGEDGAWLRLDSETYIPLNEDDLDWIDREGAGMVYNASEGFIFKFPAALFPVAHIVGPFLMEQRDEQFRLGKALGRADMARDIKRLLGESEHAS